MNIKYILLSTIFITVSLLCAVFLIQSFDKNSKSNYALSFNEFGNTTKITASYISKTDSLEKTFLVTETKSFILPNLLNNAMIDLTILEEKNRELYINLLDNSETIKANIQGLKSRENISFTFNEYTKTIPADWAGQIKADLESGKDFCLSMSSGEICHHPIKEVLKS